ncbi:MAG TPA: TonB-dependent receptor [Pseudochrobactrum sp.]|nr:TonB-dependent receptor [Pseudochrobactrum sp.]
MSVVRHYLHASLAGTILSVSGLGFAGLGFSAGIAVAQERETLIQDRAPDKAADSATQLKTITVSGGQNGPFVQGDGVYRTPAPVSSVSGAALQERFGGNPQTALRSTPGVFTRQQSNQPGIEVNIRGMSGFGRVNAMIDGVPQTFRNVAGHASSGGSMLYVQPELLGGIDVSKGAVSGAAGMGTLSGAANFRTLDFDDIVLPGRDVGVLTRWKAGTNGFRGSGMLAGAARANLNDDKSSNVSILGAFARTSFGTFKNGDGVYVDKGRDATNRPGGGLLKFEIAPSSEHNLKLGARWYENRFTYANYEQGLKNASYTANYAYTPDDNDWVDLKVNAYYNRTNMDYAATGGSYRGRKTDNRGYGFDVSNTSRTMLSDDVQLKLFYGGSFGNDEYQINAYRGGNPPGTLQKSSGFTDATLLWNMFTLTGGLRYDHWNVEGYQPPYAAGTGDCPAGGAACGNKDIERNSGKWLPKVSLTAQPYDGLELYATYSHTFRPPTVQEMFFSGVPFGTGLGSGVANNLNLEPEYSKGWDIGVNFTENGLLRSDDKFRLKTGFFHNSIENFVVNDFVNVPNRGPTAMWINRPGITKMYGWEVEGSYDLGFFYTNVSYTNAKTDQPIGEGMGDAFMLPDQYGTLDAGIRLFDEKLTLGAQARYFGKSSYAGTGIDYGQRLALPSYMLYDLYGSYKLKENAELFFSVENVANKNYRVAVSGPLGEDEYSGKGRSFIFGASAKF